MQTKNSLLFSFLIFGLVLFMGSVDSRIKKAKFFSKTILSPFILSINNFNSYAKIKQYNNELQIQLANQFIENAHLKTLLQKNQLYKFEYATKDTAFVLADVIGITGNLSSFNIIVNKGQKHGVENNDPVLSSKGIVGKVVQSYYDFSVIMPMTSPDFKLAILDKNTNIQGILETSVSEQTYISFISVGSTISIGDTIVTSNLSQLFPPGYPVGTISSIEESQDAMYIKGRITPKTAFNNLESVFILKPEKKEDYEAIIKSNY